MPTASARSWPQGTPTATWPCSCGPPPARTGPCNYSCTTPTATGNTPTTGDPVLGSGTEQIQAAATDHKWTVIDMAADWVAVARRTVGPLGIDKARLGRYPPADP